ncbi:MAG: phosphoglucosamine mutase [Candidatus Woesearchaeota archaeon]
MKKTLFGTDGMRGIANIHPMTPEVVVRLGKAIVEALKNGTRPKILIGKDTRLSGYMLESALTTGICSMGGDVLLVGPMPTPAIAHLTRSFAADAGVVISASHNPWEHNGIKIFSSKGIKLPDDIELRLEQLMIKDARNEHVQGIAIGKAKRIDDAKGRYIEFAKAAIDNFPLQGLKVVLDCANGAAYDITPHILQELGAEVIIMFNEPNGTNINKECGSLHPEVMQQAVLKHKADLGIALDGDADRVIMADEKGNLVDGDHLMAIIALDLKEKKQLKKDTVVGTVMTNKGLELYLKKQGISLVRTNVGDPYIVEEMLKNGYNFGGEQSGHIICFDHNSTPDATITSLYIMKIMKEKGKKLSELGTLFKSMPQVLLNSTVREKRELDKMPNVVNTIKSVENELGEAGRVLVRYSGTENKVRVMIEGENMQKIEAYAQDIMTTIRKELGD